MATSENSRSKLGSKREVAPGKWVIRVQAGFRADGHVRRVSRTVFGTETEAVERVRLGKETVTDTETVSGEVRKEQIEFDDPSGTSR